MDNSSLGRLKEFLEEKECFFPGIECPKATVIVPTYNSQQAISLTISSILDQQYSNFELIVIDGGSQDKTVEIIKSIKSDKLKFISVTGNNRYEMVNKGISRAEGKYISILFPGDFYISRHTLTYVMAVAKKNNYPDLVYSGSLLRDGKKEVKILFRPLELSYLRKGRQPTSLQACWFKNEVFKKIGKFNPDLKMRGGYELLCRFLKSGKFKYSATSRVLSDYDLRSVTWKMLSSHFLETAKIIFSFFGFVSALKWLFNQKDSVRFLRLWISSLKVAFFGR